jgi:signal transduction histidine kinase
VKRITSYLFLIFLFSSLELSAQNIPDSLDYSNHELTDELVSEIMDEIKFFASRNTAIAIFLCEDLFPRLNNPELIAELHYYMGIAYRNSGSFEEATKLFYESLHIYESLGREHEMSKVYNSLSSVYFESNSLTEAQDLIEKSIAINKKLGDSIGIASNYNNMAVILKEMKNYTKALDYLYKTLDLVGGNEEIIDYRVASLINIGLILGIKGDSEGSEKILLEGYLLAEKYKLHYRIVTASSYLSDLYFNQNNIPEAEKYAHRALNIAISRNFNRQIVYAYSQLSKIYKARKNFQTALHYQELGDKLQDSINNLSLDEKITSIKTRYELAENKAREELMKVQYQKESDLLKRKNLLLVSLVIILSLSVTVFVIVYFYSKQSFRMNKELVNQQKELSTANYQKDQFFSFVAHDLKNPINNIMGFAELMVRNLSKGNNENIDRYVNQIFNSTKMLNNLVDNLLQWSRLQRGSTTFNPEVLEMQNIVKDVKEFYRPDAQQVDIDINITEVENFKVLCDKAMLLTILRNLVSNAIKFNNPGGHVFIKVENEAGMVRIAVQDNGIGIASDDIEKLFRLDIRKSQIGESEKAGSGLGLLLAQEMAKKNGTKIEVESELKVGSIFYFYLPIYEASQRQEKTNKAFSHGDYLRMLEKQKNAKGTFDEAFVNEVIDILAPLFRTVRKMPSIKDLRMFADEVEKVGNAFGIKAFIKYGSLLKYLNKQMQLDKVLQLLQEFEAMIDYIKKSKN